MLLGSMVFLSVGGLVVIVVAFGQAILDAAKQQKINSDVEDWALVLNETYWGDPDEAWVYLLEQYPIDARFVVKAKLVFMKTYW